MKSFALHLVLAISLISGCRASERPDASSPAASSAQATDSAASGAALREEIYRRARERNGGKEPTKLELLNELMGKAQEQVGAVKDYGKPRVVARGAKPEVIIRRDQIFIDGKPAAIGASMSSWRTMLRGNPRCSSEKKSGVLCAWDDLGIEVGSSFRTPKISNYLIISLNLEPKEPWIPLRPDGSIKTEPLDYRPKNPFPGYLELDGYGIDAQTKFWEIRTSADSKRNLRCNPRDCSHPHGGFSDNANLYLRLNSATEYGNVYEFTISGDEKSSAETPATK